MNIRINKEWRISSDSCNFILEKVHIPGPESKKAGEEIWKPTGFYNSFDMALSGLLKETLLRSEANTLLNLKADVASVQADIRALNRELMGGVK